MRRKKHWSDALMDLRIWGFPPCAPGMDFARRHPTPGAAWEACRAPYWLAGVVEAVTGKPLDLSGMPREPHTGSYYYDCPECAAEADWIRAHYKCPTMAEIRKAGVKK